MKITTIGLTAIVLLTAVIPSKAQEAYPPRSHEAENAMRFLFGGGRGYSDEEYRNRQIQIEQERRIQMLESQRHEAERDASYERHMPYYAR